MIISQFNKKIQIIVLVFLLLLSLVPVYFINYRAIKASYYHYWGINYYLNGVKDKSYEYWKVAINTPNPYLNGSRVDFATTIQEGYQGGIILEPIQEVYKEGIVEMKKAIASEPENYFFYTFLSEYLNIFSDFDISYLNEAEKLEDMAWQWSPRRQQILYAMAKTALLKGDDKKGYALFQRAVDLNPAAGDPHFFLGLIALARKNTELGLAEIKLAEKLGRRPKNIKEAISLGNLIGDTGDYKKAIVYYATALKDFGGDPNYKFWSVELRLKIAVAYYYDGDREKAFQAFINLAKDVDLKVSPVYPQIKAMMEELGIQ